VVKKLKDTGRLVVFYGEQIIKHGGDALKYYGPGFDPRWWEEKLRIIEEMKRDGTWEGAAPVPRH
jgi:hypothetical protein